MNRYLPIALAMLAMLPLCAQAQTASNCPTLPASSGLKWELLDGPGFLFCRALREDGSEAFAVTLGRTSPFKPSRSNRVQEGRVDGQPIYWYASQIAGRDAEVVRETLVEVPGGNVAHVSLRARDSAGAEAAMQQVQSLTFRDARLSSN